MGINIHYDWDVNSGELSEECIALLKHCVTQNTTVNAIQISSNIIRQAQVNDLAILINKPLKLLKLQFFCETKQDAEKLINIIKQNTLIDEYECSISAYDFKWEHSFKKGTILSSLVEQPGESNLSFSEYCDLYAPKSSDLMYLYNSLKESVEESAESVKQSCKLLANFASACMPDFDQSDEVRRLKRE